MKNNSILFQTRNHLSRFLIGFVLISAVYIAIFVMGISMYFLIGYIILAVFLFMKFVKKFVFYEDRVEIIYPFRFSNSLFSKKILIFYSEVDVIIINKRFPVNNVVPTITVRVEETQEKHSFDIIDFTDADKMLNHCETIGIKIIRK